MKKIVHLISLLLLASAWMMAQTSSYPSDSNQTSQQGQGTSDTSNQQTIRGCLAGSNGNYTLTDNAGNSYQLTGNTSRLEKHVGHEVELRGKATPSSQTGDNSQTGANSGEANAGGQQTFEVMSFKHIADSCNTSQNQ